MGQIITSQFSLNDVAYYPIYAQCAIYPVQVVAVYLRDIDGTTTIVYDVVRLDKQFLIPGVVEGQIFTFANAKTVLLSYLQKQINVITNLTATNV